MRDLREQVMKYIITKAEIEQLAGLDKTHFLNENAKRLNKSLGDQVGLNNIGFHIIEVPPGHESTEYHTHHSEDECTYVLSGHGTVVDLVERSAIKNPSVGTKT